MSPVAVLYVEIVVTQKQCCGKNQMTPVMVHYLKNMGYLKTRFF